VKQSTAEIESLAAVMVREQAVVADTLEPGKEIVEQETAEELIGGKGHQLGTLFMAVVLPAEGDQVVLLGDEPLIGDGDAVCVAA